MDYPTHLFGSQVKQRRAADLVTLLAADVDLRLAPVAMAHQVTRQAPVPTTGCRVFGDAEAIRKHAHADVVLWLVRLGAEDHQRLCPGVSDQGIVLLFVYPDASQGVQRFERDQDLRQPGGYLLGSYSPPVRWCWLWEG